MVVSAIFDGLDPSFGQPIRLYFGAYEWTGFAIWYVLDASQWSDILGDVPDKFYLNLALLAVFTLGGAWISVKSALDGQKNRAITRKIA